nr:uncharacterized protein LOC104002369 isoform X3 [Pan troglodytes]
MARRLLAMRRSHSCSAPSVPGVPSQATDLPLRKGIEQGVGGDLWGLGPGAPACLDEEEVKTLSPTPQDTLSVPDRCCVVSHLMENPCGREPRVVAGQQQARS